MLATIDAMPPSVSQRGFGSGDHLVGPRSARLRTRSGRGFGLWSAAYGGRFGFDIATDLANDNCKNAKAFVIAVDEGLPGPRSWKPPV